MALQIGHRVSIDLDLFTPEDYDKDMLIQALDEEFEFSIVSEENRMLISYVNQIKVDFVKMSYPILFPPLLVEGVRMLDIKDIAPMKLKAITQRGSKKDFFDLYYLLESMPLERILELFKKKFKQYEVFHVIKSLGYFEDAEQYADPVVFDKTVSWEKVKSRITKAVADLMT